MDDTLPPTAPVPADPAPSDESQVIAETMKPRVWTVFVAVVVALVGSIGIQSVMVAAVVAWRIAQGGDVDEVVQGLQKSLGTADMFILLASCGQVAMLLVILGAAALSPVPWRERLGLLRPRSSARFNLLATVGSLVPLAIGFAMAAAMKGLLPGDPSVEALLENMTPIGWVAFILFIATVPPVVEEILFRGYVQRRLLARWSPLWAIGMTSLMFALMHVMPMAVIALLPLSVWLGVVAWRAGSVYPSMMCHALVNGGINIWRMVAKFGELSETVQSVAVVVVLLCSLVCWLLACREVFGQGLENDAVAEPASP